MCHVIKASLKFVNHSVQREKKNDALEIFIYFLILN